MKIEKNKKVSVSDSDSDLDSDKKFRFQYQYRNWTWVSVPDTETWFRSHATLCTPPRTHRIRGQKSQVLKPTFLPKNDGEKQRPYQRRLNPALCVLQTYFRISL